jgi:hypothetical protein
MRPPLHKPPGMCDRSCWFLMNDYGVLNSRKRAIIALMHSLVFLAVAGHGFVSPKLGLVYWLAGSQPAKTAPGGATSGDFILVGIYLVVACILTWLVSLSRCAWERIYFALCTCSATFGLLRAVFGDAGIPAAQYLRVVMLSGAVGVGTAIVRSFTRPAAESALASKSSHRKKPPGKLPGRPFQEVGQGSA